MTYEKKLQKLGKSLYVSLPKTWVRRMQLGKGDKVTQIEQRDGSIALYPAVKEGVSREITLCVEAEESTRSLRRRITGAYVNGFDIIRLKAKDRLPSYQQDTIRETTEVLFGLTIINVTPNSITTRCLLTRMHIKNILPEIHGMIKTMLSETISALKQGNTEAAKNIIKWTLNTKRLFFVTHRLLRSSILYPVEQIPEMNLIDSVDFLRVINKITEVSGNIRRIAESIIASEEPYPNYLLASLIGTCNKVLESYDFSMQSLMTKDVKLANHVLDQKWETSFDDQWMLFSKEGGQTEICGRTFSHIHRIVDNLERIYLYALEIAEIAIDRSEEL